MIEVIASHMEEIDPASFRGERRRVSRMRELFDHSRRIVNALEGFRLYGRGWLRPWATYCLSPILSRFAGETVARFDAFNARLGECDLYTFANVFADYPIDELLAALREVNLVVDLGANVGAFSFLIQRLCRKLRCQRRIIALEPDATNIAFLREQPFADALEIHQAAVSSREGTARLVAGENSVTHYVDLSPKADGLPIRTLSLASLCDEPALVKMDIEGGELNILEHGLAENVRHLVLEWHHPGAPVDFVPGNWKRIATDIHGASTWYLHR
jgi:FkbM family methyltransferase